MEWEKHIRDAEYRRTRTTIVNIYAVQNVKKAPRCNGLSGSIITAQRAVILPDSQSVN